MFASDKLNYNIETIDGTPQKVYKFPLQNYPEEGFVGATVPELLQRIIVGPVEHARTIRDALIDVLISSGIPDAEKRVVVSDIPLRGGRHR